LIAGAVLGMTTQTGTPRICPARARAWAWLPEEWVTTPRPFAESSSCNIAFRAPRILNAPTFCRFSALSTTEPPVIASSVRDESRGVRWM
jgi:hypothetical protein